MVRDHKQKLLDFRLNSADFTRNRQLTLEHTIGLLLSMACARNSNGYDISSQNYFHELSVHLGDPVHPARRQSVSEARSKLGWQAIEYLLGCSNLEAAGLPSHLKFQGHVTRAIDGTSFYTPRSPDLLSHFTPRNTRADEKETHYPYGMCVAAINVFTGQPVGAVVEDYRASERSGLKRLIAGFSPGDLALLDRGLGGALVYREFQRYEQYFIHRVTAAGGSVAKYVQKFLGTGKKQHIFTLPVKGEKSREPTSVRLRILLGSQDHDGNPIVFITNLLDKKRYKRSAILKLYQKRWTVETLYGRVKHLLNLEKFHARSYNGVMQEIFANLLILSLTAAAVCAVIDQDELDTEVELPSFKAAAEVVRRHLFSTVDHRIVGTKPKKLLKQMLAEVRSVMYPIRPGRSYPRVSMQPIKSWNLKKSAKLKAFKRQKKALT